MRMNTNSITMTTLPEFAPKIVQLLKSNLTPRKMQEQLNVYHEKDIALTLPELTQAEQRRLFRLLSPQRLAAVLEYATTPGDCFTALTFAQRRDLLPCMEPGDASELLQQLEQNERELLLSSLPMQAQLEIGLFRSFSEDEIGSRMSTNYITIPDTASIKQAMNCLIHQAAENDHISVLYLVDEAEVFTGAISLKDLIIARADTPLKDITTFSYPYLYARTAIADCLPFLTEYAEASIPVLDDAHHLLGVVTSEDVAELLGDELGDDYAKLAGLSSEEDLAEPLMQSVRKRLPWLCILLVLGLGVSAAVGLFEGIVSQLPVIMCFQSLILDMAGNVGTQSLAVAIRVLMDTQLGRKHKAALVWKEARIGLLNGCLLGLLSFFVIGSYLCVTGHDAAFSFAVSGCLGVAMLLAMLVSSLSGTLIPIAFQHLGVDPAVASGPLITTVNDLIAVIAYYGLAWLILLQIMHLA